MTRWTYPALLAFIHSSAECAFCALKKVIDSASSIAILITDTYFQPNKTPAELQAMMHDGGVDPLRDFSEVCRNELESDLLA